MQRRGGERGAYSGGDALVVLCLIRMFIYEYTNSHTLNTLVKEENITKFGVGKGRGDKCH